MPTRIAGRSEKKTARHQKQLDREAQNAREHKLNPVWLDRWQMRKSIRTTDRLRVRRNNAVDQSWMA